MPKRHVGTGSSFFDKLEPRTLLDASLSPPVIFQGDDPVITAAAGDFDGDGFQDLAVASYGPVGKRLAFLKGNGDGTFEAPRFSRYTHQIAQLAAADFDGDGRDELVLSGLAANGQRSRLARIEFNDDAQRLRVVSARPVPGFVQGIDVVRIAEGPSHVLFAVRTQAPPELNLQTPYLIHSIAFNDPALPIVQTPVESTLAQWRGFRVADANADGLDDIVITSQDFQYPDDEEFSVRILTQNTDPILAGMFASGTVLLSVQGYAWNSALLDDVDLDGHADLVVQLADDVLLYRGDGAGGLLPPEVLFAGPSVYGGSNTFEILGFQVGPTGEPELQVFHSHTVGGRQPYGSQSLLRFLPQGDGTFSLRQAFQRNNGGYTITDRFQMLQLTSDAHADVLWLSERHRYQVQLFTFTGEPGAPAVTEVEARPARRPFQQTVTTGQAIVLKARINDPEKLIGEPGGIRSVQFFLDTNSNGIIDAGDVLAATKRQRVTVAAHWPRGTFNILAQAIDVTGLVSEVACGERTLTIM